MKRGNRYTIYTAPALDESIVFGIANISDICYIFHVPNFYLFKGKSLKFSYFMWARAVWCSLASGRSIQIKIFLELL